MLLMKCSLLMQLENLEVAFKKVKQKLLDKMTEEREADGLERLSLTEWQENEEDVHKRYQTFGYTRSDIVLQFYFVI